MTHSQIAALLLGTTSLLALGQPIEVKTSASEFDPDILYSTPLLNGRSHEGDDDLSVNVQANKHKGSGRMQWRLVLQAIYHGARWRNYSHVSLVGGEQLPGKRVLAEVVGCRSSSCKYAEGVAVVLPDHVVTRALTEGLPLRWNAALTGGFELQVPASHFAAVAATAGATPSGEQQQDEQAITFCWDKQGLTTLPSDTRRIIATLCEQGEAEYFRKYGRYYTRSGKKP